MTASIAAAAKTHPPRVVSGRLPQLPTRLARVVRAIQRPPAFAAALRAHRLGARQVDPRQTLPEIAQRPLVPHATRHRADALP